MKLLVLETYTKRGEPLPATIYVGVDDIAVPPSEILELIKAEYSGKVVLDKDAHIGIENFSGGSSDDIDHLDEFLLRHGYMREPVARITHIYSVSKD